MSATDSRGRWEALCHRCGRCCFEKIEFEGEVYYTDEPCQFLDSETRLCRVYDQRRQKRPDCLPVTEKLIEKGWLPTGCGYVMDIADYLGPHMWDEDVDEDEGQG